MATKCPQAFARLAGVHRAAQQQLRSSSVSATTRGAGAGLSLIDFDAPPPPPPSAAGRSLELEREWASAAYAEQRLAAFLSRPGHSLTPLPRAQTTAARTPDLEPAIAASSSSASFGAVAEFLAAARRDITAAAAAPTDYSPADAITLDWVRSGAAAAPKETPEFAVPSISYGFGAAVAAEPGMPREGRRAAVAKFLATARGDADSAAAAATAATEYSPADAMALGWARPGAASPAAGVDARAAAAAAMPAAAVTAPSFGAAVAAKPGMTRASRRSAIAGFLAAARGDAAVAAAPTDYSPADAITLDWVRSGAAAAPKETPEFAVPSISIAEPGMPREGRPTAIAEFLATARGDADSATAGDATRYSPAHALQVELSRAPRE